MSVYISVTFVVCVIVESSVVLEPFATAVVELAGVSFVGIHAGLGLVRVVFHRKSVGHSVVHLGASASGHRALSVGEDVSEERYPFLLAVEPYLLGMQGKHELVLEEVAYGDYEPLEFLLCFCDYVEVVDVSSVMSAFEYPLAVLVEQVKVDVAEQLACEVSYRESAAGKGKEQAFVFRKAVPVGASTLYPAALRGVVEDDLFEKPSYYWPFRSLVVPCAVDGIKDYFKELLLAYRHEVSLQVELQHPAGAREALRYTSYVLFEPLYAEVISAAFEARIGVVYEPILPYWKEPPVKQVVDYPVPERCGEIFPSVPGRR